MLQILSKSFLNCNSFCSVLCCQCCTSHFAWRQGSRARSLASVGSHSLQQCAPASASGSFKLLHVFVPQAAAKQLQVSCRLDCAYRDRIRPQARIRTTECHRNEDCKQRAPSTEQNNSQACHLISDSMQHHQPLRPRPELGASQSRQLVPVCCTRVVILLSTRFVFVTCIRCLSCAALLCVEIG